MTDPVALAHAAQVLVQTALRARAGEHVVIVEDAGSVAIGDAVAAAVEACGGWVKRARLDRIATAAGAARPHKVIPDLLLLALRDAECSVFLAGAMPAEWPMRQALLHVVGQRGLRHAHMPGLSEAAFVAGLRLDHAHVDRLGRRVLGRVQGARRILTESAAGTSLRIELAPEGKWLAQLGVLEPGRWGNLPGGALYASPTDVSGVFVADASVGEFFGAREGILQANPVRLVVEAGRVVDVEARSPDLGRDIRAMMAVAPNSARVGLVAVGVNIGICSPIGDAVVDQNVPGLHIGIGDPASRTTGAGWSAPTCFAACQATSHVWVDGEPIIAGGRVVIASRPAMSAIARLDSPPPQGA